MIEINFKQQEVCIKGSDETTEQVKLPVLKTFFQFPNLTRLQSVFNIVVCFAV